MGEDRENSWSAALGEDRENSWSDRHFAPFAPSVTRGPEGHYGDGARERYAKPTRECRPLGLRERSVQVSGQQKKGEGEVRKLYAEGFSCITRTLHKTQ